MKSSFTSLAGVSSLFSFFYHSLGAAAEARVEVINSDYEGDLTISNVFLETRSASEKLSSSYVTIPFFPWAQIQVKIECSNREYVYNTSHLKYDFGSELSSKTPAYPRLELSETTTFIKQTCRNNESVSDTGFKLNIN